MVQFNYNLTWEEELSNKSSQIRNNMSDSITNMVITFLHCINEYTWCWYSLLHTRKLLSYTLFKYTSSYIMEMLINILCRWSSIIYEQCLWSILQPKGSPYALIVAVCSCVKSNKILCLKKVRNSFFEAHLS